MAEKSKDTSPSEAGTTSNEQSGNWWDSWITSAKSKSAEVYTMVKKDLDEIGSAVKSEASHVLSTTSNVIGKTLKLDVPESPANVMKKSFSTFIGQVSTVLNPEPDDEDDTEVILSSGDTTMLSTYKKELEALQRVDATFLVPANSAEFDAWRASVGGAGGEVVSGEGAVRRLAASPLLRAQYQRLVPDAVAHTDFWERYLFRVALLQDRLAAASRKQPQEAPPPCSSDPVMAHLPLQTPDQLSPKKEVIPVREEKEQYEVADVANVTWEEEDFANEMELTEEQQILLLEEYEKEITSKKLNKQTSSRDIANNNTDTKTTNTDNKKTKNAQTTDNMNNRTTDNKRAVDKRNKDGRSPKKGTKSDVCGNNLVEDYFGEKETKDDASANSDESWEKEFEIDEVVQK